METRLILLKEDYGDTILYLTDLDNSQLKAILKKCIENDENSIGEDPEEICSYLFPKNFCYYLDTSEKHIELKEVDFCCIVEYSYYGFCEVK